MACLKFPKFTDCKDPNSYIPYSFDWSDWTTAESTTLVDDVDNREIIIAVTDNFDASEDTTPIVVGSILVDVPNSIIYAWLSGGTAGIKYNVTCRITASNGIIEDQTAVLSCGEK
jgi:hypothetical protein